jgi:hypothetical protein
MAPAKPNAVEIRTYQVGFGDCFLLSFVYGDEERRHVLIDFGSSGMTPRQGKTGEAGSKPAAKTRPKVTDRMRAIAGDISRVCGDRGLTAVVATHRHSDHISGFETNKKKTASGDVIAGLNPLLVLQPWTEDPDAPRNARAATRGSRVPGFVASLAEMNALAEAMVEFAVRPPYWMSAPLRNQLSFVGMTNVANRSAIDNLIAMGARSGANAEWGHHGFKTLLGDLLGVQVHVLGPPTLEQTDKIRKMRTRDPDQFWHLMANAPLARAVTLYPRGVPHGVPVPASGRWFRDRLERLTGEQMLEIVRTLDDQMNNTSLILLFEVCGKKLLFPGDAQIENWSYALEDAPTAARTQALLRDVDVYKVGHHGSLNATPKKALWEHFVKRKTRQLRTLLSTMPGKHGTSRSGTEVPRKPLLDALKAESVLQNTDDLGFAAKAPLCYGLRVTAGRAPVAFDPR